MARCSFFHLTPPGSAVGKGDRAPHSTLASAARAVVQRITEFDFDDLPGPSEATDGSVAALLVQLMARYPISFRCSQYCAIVRPHF